MNQINFTAISIYRILSKLPTFQFEKNLYIIHTVTYHTSLLHSKQKIILVRADKAGKDEVLMDREHFVCTCISLYSKDL